jgi:hypothetical protein
MFGNLVHKSAAAGATVLLTVREPDFDDTNHLSGFGCDKKVFIPTGEARSASNCSVLIGHSCFSG